MESVKKPLRTAVAAMLVAGMLGVGAVGVASAGSHGASITGSSAWSTGTTAYNKDTAADSQFTKTIWYARGSSGEVVNRSGYNARVSRNTGKDITAVKACVSRTAKPMVCSDPNNQY